MVVNIKKLFIALLLFPIYLHSSDNHKNQAFVLKELKNNIENSKKVLSDQIGICLKKGNSNLIEFKNINILKNFKIEDVSNFLKFKYHHNFNNCLSQKDHLYVFNLSRLYHAQKEYEVNTTNTLANIKSYFEPIQALDERIEYKNSPDKLKKYFNDLIGDRPFNFLEIAKTISSHYKIYSK